MLSIDFIDETNIVEEKDTDLVSSLLQFAAKEEGIAEECELSVTFVDNAAIRDINREYRGKDSATDVISFAMEEMGELIQEISKDLRGKGNVQKMAEEIADVQIMLDQLMIMHDCGEAVDEFKFAKFIRLRNRLEGKE